MDTENLRLLVEVARRGGFAPVARDRGLDPSSVSRAVAALEAELGLRLFQRTTRRTVPTEAGGLFLRRVEAVMDELDGAREAALAVSSGPAGTLRVTTSVAFGLRCLVPLLPELREAHPDLKLDLVLTDANLDLVEERIDLAIRLGPRVEADVIGVKLMDTRYRVCASPEYLARVAAPQSPDDLRSHRCLLYALPDLRARWRFRDERNGAVTEVPVDGDVVVSNPLALRDCAVAGLGPALLAGWLVDEDVARGRLVQLLPDHRATATEFETAAWALYPSRAFLPGKVRVVIDLLRRRLRTGNRAPFGGA